MNLSTLASTYKTDKGDSPLRKWTPKHYTHAYEKCFKSLKDENITLLELGIKYGGSLRLWRDYFTNAKVIGIDIDPEHTKPIEGVDCILGDCTDHLFLAEQFGDQEFDVVIDDASHRFEDIVKSFEFFHPRTRKYYFVENQVNAPGLLKWLDDKGVEYKAEQKDLIIIPCKSQS